MTRRPIRAPRTAPAFTLAEIMVAMAITATMIVTMSAFLFSMGELWGKNSDRYLFDLHVRNVTRFLAAELASSALPPSGGSAGAQNTATAGAAATTAPVTIQEIRDQTGNTDHYLTYELPNGSRLCFWPDRALPGVVCSLAYREGQGLILLWHSRYEINYDIDAPRETVITPLVTGMTYDYYDLDLKTWKNEPILLKDNSNEGILPQRIRLLFTYGERTAETVLDIPGPPVQGLPML